MANNSHSLPGHSCGRMLNLFGEQTYAGGSRPFALPGDKPHYAPNREYALKHIFLDIAVDFETTSVAGVAYTTLTAVNNGLNSITFDSDHTVVSKVWVQGEDEPLSFSHQGGKLKINLGKPHSSGQDLTVAIEYRATPRSGLYFIGPDEAYPDKKLQVWSQGQDTDNHFWFPCYDAPNQKCTTEIRVCVPENMYALSNGGLLETTQDVIAKTKTYHWKMSIPHSTYLVMLAVADFVEIMDSWDGIPVPYYVLPGGEEKARISLGKTPQMMQFFSEKIGLRYPYEKYATVCVSSFIFGGMENTTATTLTEYTLHDERAHQDFSSDPLVAHELVHQWFGDWLTCRDWSHGWLNEGFATYFEALWAEYDLGRDEFIYELYQNAVNYFGEDSGNYRRPIVTNVFHSPIDLFDRHLYEKGSLVLHMVRYILGEELWWKAINYYTNKHKGQSVITADLERAIEEATGVNMQGFFEQWVYKAGYPQFKLDWSYDDKTTTARFKVAQTQEVNHETSLFTLPVEIAFVSESGKREVFKVELEEKEQTFYFKLSEKPLFAGFDPSNWILKTVEWKRPKEQLIAQLEKDPEVFMRVVAAQELGKQGGLEAIAALQKALAGDGFWGVKVEAAKGLGVIKTRAAEEALLKALESEQNAKVRRAIVSALGEFRTEPAATALVKVLSGDKTDIVEGVAATALGKTRQPVAFEALKAALERDSFNQVVRNGTLNGLVELKEDVKVLPLVMEWTAYGKPEQVRQTAATFLGTIGKRLKEAEKEPVVDRIIELLQDPNWRVRLASIRAAQTLGDARAIPRLQSIVETALEGREVRLSREAIKAIREGSERDEEVKKLREDLDKLQGENRELKERLESLEQKLK